MSPKKLTEEEKSHMNDMKLPYTVAYGFFLGFVMGFLDGFPGGWLIIAPFSTLIFFFFYFTIMDEWE